MKEEGRRMKFCPSAFFFEAESYFQEKHTLDLKRVVLIHPGREGRFFGKAAAASS